MNTKNNWLTTATIHDEQRRALWSDVFPGAVVPIKSMLACSVNVPERGKALAYMLDLDAISDEQREGLIRVISERFNYPAEEVRQEIDRGVPILAEDVSVGTRDQGMFLSLIDDENHTPFWDHNEDLSDLQEWEDD